MQDLSKFIPVKGSFEKYIINKEGVVYSVNSNKLGGGKQPLKLLQGKYYTMCINGVDVKRSRNRLIRENFGEQINLNKFEFVKGFPKYKINRNGEIYSLFQNKVRKGCPDKKGYLRIMIYRDGKYHPRKVHRLVAQQFIPNPKNKPQVNHKNGNKTDNSVKNLEWATNLENMQHAWKNGYFDYHKK